MRYFFIVGERRGTQGGRSSLPDEDLDVGLRRELVAAAALVAVLAWPAEALASFWQRAARLARRAVVVVGAKGAVAANGTRVLPGCHLAERTRAAALSE